MSSGARDEPAGRVPGLVLGAAREHGPVPEGGFRVVVLESGGELRVCDFPALEEAAAYASDVASESDTPPPLAYVFDDGLECVGRGRHYASS